MPPEPNSPTRFRWQEDGTADELHHVAPKPKVLSTVLEEDTPRTRSSDVVIPISPKTNRAKPFPNTILDRQALEQALDNAGIIVKPRKIDYFYEHLHRQNYPPLPAFVQSYKAVLAEHTEISDDDSISVFSSPGGGSIISRTDTRHSLHHRYSRHKLPTNFLDFLENPNSGFVTTTSQVVGKKTSASGNSCKIIIALHDGLLVETFISKYHENNGDHASVSVSSQVGCDVGCSYCPISGFKGNLTAGEIVEQAVHAQQVFSQDNVHVVGNHAVLKVTFSGSGEPLHNYNNVVQACHYLANQKSWNLCRGRITISTVGITPRIYDLTRDLPNVILSLGLHAPNQALRRTIVPVAEQYPLDKLMEALDNHMNDPQDRVQRTLLSPSGRKRRMVMVEYIMMEGRTSSLDCAHQLGKLCENRHLVVNLIPYIVHGDTDEKRSCPTPDHIKQFQSIVASYGAICNVRLNLSVEVSKMVSRQLKMDKHSFMEVPTDIEDLGFWQKLAFVRNAGWNKEALRERLERRREGQVPREIHVTNTSKNAISHTTALSNVITGLVESTTSSVSRAVLSTTASPVDQEKDLSSNHKPVNGFAGDCRRHNARRWILPIAVVTVVFCRILVTERRR
jgi:sorting nexin-8